MTAIAHKLCPHLLLILPLILHAVSGQTDTINADQIITDGDTLVSSSGKFALGFFSPGNSKNRYVGMWFNRINQTTIVWVANREAPLTDNSGVLKLIHPGILILLNSTNMTVWSSNATTATARSPVAQLLDSGNLVVRDSGDEHFLWQSFDYPTDTYLPGMNFGWNLVTGKENYISSWRSNDDPATGDVSLHLDPTGYPQMLLKKGGVVLSRNGPWNGIQFPGPPNPVEDPTYKLTFVMDAEKVYFRSDAVDAAFVSRYSVNQSGVSQRWVWADRSGWAIYYSMPADLCDNYGLCGAYGRCNVASSPSCGCLDHRFVPRDPERWGRADWSNGCVRRSNLSCSGDVFVEYSGIKLPDARKSRHNATMTIEECKAECLRDCSCMAYSELDVRNKSGCLIWYDELIDIRTLSQDGQVIYIRMASSEAESGGKKHMVLIPSVASVMGVVLLVLCLGLYLWRKRKRKRKRKRENSKKMMGEEGKYSGGEENDSNLPFWELSVILEATNHFSITNKLGEGGFGPVYKGKLEGGQEIAVKRLSKESKQGLKELKNEVIFIAKLRHKNLVKLLGCCVKEDESMLIYEYMPNKSLDLILFDQTKSTLLDWEKRIHIINGVARGLLYLHQDAPLTIIHRDLKASNILLDSEMNPKISDFGLARSFGGDETEAQTHRVVGTYGYMSPEYAVDGMFSIKSDVFSFGVLLLEIVSGKRNRGFSHSDHSLNLLGHAWKLYKEGRVIELVDPSIKGQFENAEVEKTIRVGLLCVQQNPDDRPNMWSVVWMLGNEGEIPQEAKQPGFFTGRDMVSGQKSSSTNINTINEVTITMLQPR